MSKIAAYFYDLCVSYGALIKNDDIERIKLEIELVYSYFTVLSKEYEEAIFEDKDKSVYFIDFALEHTEIFDLSDQEVAFMKDIKTRIEQETLDFDEMFEKYENTEGSFFVQLNKKILGKIKLLDDNNLKYGVLFKNLTFFIESFKVFNACKYIESFKIEIINVLTFCYGRDYCIHKQDDGVLYSYFNNMYSSKAESLQLKYPRGFGVVITNLIDEFSENCFSQLGKDKSKVEKYYIALDDIYKKSFVYNVCVSNVALYENLINMDEENVVNLVCESIFIPSFKEKKVDYINELNPYDVKNIMEELKWIAAREYSDEKLYVDKVEKCHDKLYSHAFILDVGHNEFNINKALCLIRKRLEALRLEHLVISGKTIKDEFLTQYSSKAQKTIDYVILSFSVWYEAEYCNLINQVDFIEKYPTTYTKPKVSRALNKMSRDIDAKIKIVKERQTELNIYFCKDWY